MSVTDVDERPNGGHDVDTDTGDDARGRSRYPGAPPFGDSEMDRDLFHGRDVEGNEVLHGILSERLFVLYGASGTGKTSLLKANVMHRLRARKMWPVVVRLNRPGVNAAEQVREQMASQVRGGIDVNMAESSPSTLWGLFTHLEVSSGHIPLTPVVIFDQFEELFTLDWSETNRQALFDELAGLVHGTRPKEVGADGHARNAQAPHVKIVLSLREDALGALEDVASDIPAILRHRFRLKPLDLDQASAGIIDPAKLDDPRLRTPPFVFTPDALQLMIGFLSSREAQKTSNDHGLIEPAQLQLVCQHVEDVILPTKLAENARPISITEHDLGGRGGLGQILEQFYGRQLDALDGPTREVVRALCEGGLISKTRRRLSLERGEIAKDFAVPEPMLKNLVERRLLRSEPRVGSVYYELAHDSLVAPILSYRDAQRRAAELAAAELQRSADDLEQVRKRSNQQRRWMAAAFVGAVAIGVFAFVGGRQAAGTDPESVAPADAPRQEISLDTPVVESISEPDDVARFEFVGQAGDAVTVSVRSLGDLNPVLELQPAGARAVRIDDIDPLAIDVVTIVLSENGRQFVDVRSVEGGVGDFELLVRAEEGIGVGESISSSIDEANEVDRYPFGGLTGEAFTIDVTSDGQLDATFDVLGPERIPITGTATSEADGTSRVTFILPSDGTYVVTVGSESSTIGGYEVSLRETMALTSGADVPSELDELDSVALFPFAGRGGGAMTITATPKMGLNVVLEVLDPAGARMERADVAPANASESITVILPTDGAYLVSVRSANSLTGPFTIRLDATQVIDVDVDDDADVSGAIGSSAPTGVFRFSAGLDDVMTITMQPTADLDAVFDVLDPGAVRLLGADAVGIGSGETVSFQVREAGEFIVVARGKKASLGAYEMTIRNQREVLTEDVSVSGLIERPGEVDVFEFAGSADEMVLVSMRPTVDSDRPAADSILDAQLALFDADGAPIAFVDNAFRGDPEEAIAVLRSGGTYFANVRGFADETGPYELHLSRIAPVPVEIGNPVVGSIGEPGDVGVFKLTTVTTGTRVDLSLDPQPDTDFDPAVVLIAPTETFGVAEESNSQASGVDETGLLTLRRAGDYFFVIRGSNESTGAYTLSLSNLGVEDIDYGSTLLRSLESADGINIFEFFGKKGVSITVALETGAAFDGALDLVNASTKLAVAGLPPNNSAGPGGAETFTIQLPATGAYLLYVQGFGGSIGDYEITLS